MQLITGVFFCIKCSHFFHDLLKRFISVCSVPEHKGGEVIRIEQGERVVCIDIALFISIDERRVESGDDIFTVIIFKHTAGMQCVGIDKEAVSLSQLIQVLVHLIGHSAFQYAGDLKLGVPVAVETAELVGGKGDIYQVEGETVIAVRVQFQHIFVGDNLTNHNIPP